MFIEGLDTVHLSDPCADHWGPSVAGQQHQTSGEGPCMWTDAQDEDQEGKQPFLWWGTVTAYSQWDSRTGLKWNKMSFVFFSYLHFNLYIYIYCIFTDVLLQRAHASIRSIWSELQLPGTCPSHQYWNPMICQYVLIYKQCIAMLLSAGVRFLFTEGWQSNGGI